MRIYFEKIRKRLQAGVQFFQSCWYGRFGFGSFGIVHGDGFEPGKIENSSIALQELFAQRRELTRISLNGSNRMASWVNSRLCANNSCKAILEFSILPGSKPSPWTIPKEPN